VLDGLGCESCILDKETGEKIILQQKDDVYVFNLHVLSPKAPRFQRKALVP
jgi:hypothetical protein